MMSEKVCRRRKEQWPRLSNAKLFVWICSNWKIKITDKDKESNRFIPWFALSSKTFSLTIVLYICCSLTLCKWKKRRPPLFMSSQVTCNWFKSSYYILSFDYIILITTETLCAFISLLFLLLGVRTALFLVSSANIFYE